MLSLILINVVSFAVGLSISGILPITQLELGYKMISCVMTIIDKHTFFRTVVFYTEEEENNYLWSSIVQGMEKPFTVLSQNNSLKMDEKMVLVLFPKLNTTYTSVVHKLPKDTFYIIVGNLEGEHHYMTEILSQFHNMKMIYNIMLVPVADVDKIKIFTLFPFGGNHCSGSETGSPTIIDTFLNGNFTEKVDIFQIGKYWDMHGCILTCLGNGQSPDALLTMDKSGTISFKKTSKDLMDILNEKLNFKTEVIVPQINDSYLDHSWFFYNDTVEQITEYLANGQVDFAMGVFSRLAFTNGSALHFGKETRSECYSWVVPLGAGRDRSVVETYLGEFPFLFWNLFIVSVIVVVLFILCILNIIGEKINLKYTLSVFEYTYMTMLNQSCELKSKHSALRIFLAHWLVYILVLVTAYQAALSSLMTIPAEGFNIQSLQDLLDTSLEIAGPQQMYNILTAFPTNNSDIREVIDRFKILPASGFRDIIDRIKISRDLALFGDKRHLRSYSQDIDSVFIEPKVYFVDGCLMQSRVTHILFPFGSPLFVPFNTILYRLVESGLMQKLYTMAGEGDTRICTKHKTQLPFLSGELKMVQIRGLLLILISGYITAFFIFITEIIFHYKLGFKPINGKKLKRYKKLW